MGHKCADAFDITQKKCFLITINFVEACCNIFYVEVCVEFENYFPILVGKNNFEVEITQWIKLGSYDVYHLVKTGINYSGTGS